MGKKNKQQILESDPKDLTPSELKKYNNWKAGGTGPAGAGKKLKPVTLTTQEDAPYEEPRTESLEMTNELEEKLLVEEGEKELKRKENLSSTTHYDNGVNRWRLISKMQNRNLDIEKTMMAMNLKHGALVLISDHLASKTSISTCYIPGGQVQEDTNGKWVLK